MEPVPRSAATPEPSRLGWLDALRGIAALAVVFDHSSASFLAEFRRAVMPEFAAGRYGILVFFLVSGYIIPASLERRGDVRAFWIGRVFRIHPLCAVVVAVFLALGLAGVVKPRGGSDVVGAAVAHLTLLQELLGTPNVLMVLWTLSYEMAFYLLVVALFTVRRHERSATVAVTLAVVAAVVAVTGVALPASALSRLVGTGPLIALASTAVVAAICCASAASPALRVVGGVLGGVSALVLVAGNGTVAVWEGLVVLAVMFLGTAVHRADNGQGTWRHAACTAAVVIVCATGSAYAHGDESHFTWRGWISALLLALLTFGVGLAARGRRIPRSLLGLGAISYSVYLVHPVLLAVSDGVFGRSPRDNPVAELAFCAVLLPLCALTYRYVETPGRRWGRSLVHKGPTRLLAER